MTPAAPKQSIALAATIASRRGKRGMEPLPRRNFCRRVYRIREKSGFGVGFQHVVEVLSGADTEKVRKFGHQSLSTYTSAVNIRAPSGAPLAANSCGLACCFKTRKSSTSSNSRTRPRGAQIAAKNHAYPARGAHRTGEASHRRNRVRRGAVREAARLRKQLADERGVPPYIVFSDVSLRQMARFYPATDREFSRISGVGDRKLREFGAVFLGEIAAHLQSNPRQMFADDSFDGGTGVPPVRTGKMPVSQRSRLTDTVRETLHFFRQGKTVSEIARLRGVKDGTIYSNLEEAMLAGEEIDVKTLLTAEAHRDIAAAFAKYGFGSLGSVVASLGGRYDYGQCRIVRAALQPIGGASSTRP